MTESSIAAVRTALKTKEEALTGIVTVWKGAPAKIAPSQLPAIVHEKATWVSSRLTGRIVTEVFTIPARILVHTFPQALDDALWETAETFRRAYCDMILDNDTIAGTCSDAQAASGEVIQGSIGGVECISVLVQVQVTLYRSRS